VNAAWTLKIVAIRSCLDRSRKLESEELFHVTHLEVLLRTSNLQQDNVFKAKVKSSEFFMDVDRLFTKYERR
jgi:hypothetical protein